MIGLELLLETGVHCPSFAAGMATSARYRADAANTKVQGEFHMTSRLPIAASTAVLLSSLPAFAATSPYSAIYSFGDSLSDVGNLFCSARIPQTASRTNRCIPIRKVASATDRFGYRISGWTGPGAGDAEPSWRRRLCLRRSDDWDDGRSRRHADRSSDADRRIRRIPQVAPRASTPPTRSIRCRSARTTSSPSSMI